MRELWETELWENFVCVYGRDKETEKREGGLSPISFTVAKYNWILSMYVISEMF